MSHFICAQKMFCGLCSRGATFAAALDVRQTAHQKTEHASVCSFFIKNTVFFHRLCFSLQSKSCEITFLSLTYFFFFCLLCRLSSVCIYPFSLDLNPNAHGRS